MAFVVLAAGSLACTVIAVVVFRAAPRARGARTLVVVFALTVPGVVTALRMTDAGASPLGLAVHLWLYAAVFFGGILQLYNIADRGFSLRILIDHVRPGGGFVLADVLRGYSAGRGIEWMLDKRIADVLHHRLVREEGGRYHLTERGARTARLFRRLKALYALGEGG